MEGTSRPVLEIKVFFQIRNGKLTKERADTVSARQEGLEVGEGDVFSAAALSVVLHTRNPFVPVSFGVRIAIF